MSDDLRAENAELRRRLDSVMHAGDMEHARMAALLGAANDMLNQLAVMRYPDESTLWKLGGAALESAYVELKRSADAVRPQADTFLARLADLSRMVGEQNTTIGYQDAMLQELRTALDQIDRHIVGAYETDSGSVEPCEECGEMREIAAQALAATKASKL